MGTVADNGLPKAHGTNVMAKDEKIGIEPTVAASPGPVSLQFLNAL